MASNRIGQWYFLKQIGFSLSLKYVIAPKLSDSPYLTREAEMPQTLLECNMLKVWAINLKLSPNL
jgi:hypothetical protein